LWRGDHEICLRHRSNLEEGGRRKGRSGKEGLLETIVSMDRRKNLYLRCDTGDKKCNGWERVKGWEGWRVQR